MDNVEFAEDGGGVGGQDHLLEMVDDDLVASIGTKGCLDGGGDCATSIDIAEDGSIFRVVARIGS